MIATDCLPWKGLAEFVTVGSRGPAGIRNGRSRGNHGRSLSRFSVLVGSAITAGFLLAGCATQVPGAAVIAAPAAVAPAVTPPAGDFLAGLEQAVANELNAINSTQTDDTTPAVLIELNALNSMSSLLQAETFSSSDHHRRQSDCQARARHERTHGRREGCRLPQRRRDQRIGPLQSVACADRPGERTAPVTGSRRRVRRR